MPLTPIEDVTQGQVLRERVATTDGLVVPAGSRLTADLLDRLRRAGVARLDVRPAPPGDGPPAEPDARPAWLVELDARFAGHEGDELMTALKAIVRAKFEESA